MFTFFKSWKVTGVVLILLFSITASTALAVTRCETTDVTKSGEPYIKLQVPIGEAQCVSGISEYISTFYNFFVGAVATLAIFMIVIGGVMWLFARGDSGRITAAKSTINSAITGMLLVFISVSLLRIINPDLISLKFPKLKSISQVIFYDTIKCDDPLLVGKKIKVGDESVDGGTSDKRFICMESYNIEGTQQVCAGTSCVSPSGEDGTCTPKDCFYGYGVWGSIGWEKNFFVDNIWLMAVCPNYTLLQTSLEENIAERDTAYKFSFDQKELEDVKKGLGGACYQKEPIGYLLQAAVNDFGGIDDKVVIDGTCQKFVVKADKPEEFAHEFDEIPQSTFLLTENDLRAHKECIIFIKQDPEKNLVLPVMADSLIYKDQQWASATIELKKFLVDLNQKYRIIVTSVSDDDIFTGNCEPLNPQETFRDDNNCVHVQNSAHYGGTNVNNRTNLQNSKKEFSCAADVKPADGKSWDVLYASATSASSKWCERAGDTNPVPCEPGVTHLHLTVSGCGTYDSP